MTGRLRSPGILVFLIFLQWTGAFAFELVRDGEPQAEIVLVGDAMPQAVLAASELRDHVEKISGARLSIVSAPSDELPPIYIGESTYTRTWSIWRESRRASMSRHGRCKTASSGESIT